jgi:hypothetical protein
MNIKRGFNRLFIVLTVFWAIYCLFVYPIQQRREAQTAYNNELRVCWEHELGKGQEFKDCLETARLSSQVDQWSLRAFYTRESWFLVLVVIVVPLIAYGFCRGLATVGLWVWHRFKPHRSAPRDQS